MSQDSASTIINKQPILFHLCLPPSQKPPLLYYFKENPRHNHLIHKYIQMNFTRKKSDISLSQPHLLVTIHIHYSEAPWSYLFKVL